MAIRYCGELTIRVSYLDSSSEYRCTVSRAGKHLATLYVGEPKILCRAVDHPEAYDSAAHAALSFCEDSAVEDGASWTYDRWDIRRRK